MHLAPLVLTRILGEIGGTPESPIPVGSVNPPETQVFPQASPPSTPPAASREPPPSNSLRTNPVSPPPSPDPPTQQSSPPPVSSPPSNPPTIIPPPTTSQATNSLPLPLTTPKSDSSSQPAEETPKEEPLEKPTSSSPTPPSSSSQNNSPHQPSPKSSHNSHSNPGTTSPELSRPPPLSGPPSSPNLPSYSSPSPPSNSLSSPGSPSIVQHSSSSSSSPIVQHSPPSPPGSPAFLFVPSFVPPNTPSTDRSSRNAPALSAREGGLSNEAELGLGLALGFLGLGVVGVIAWFLSRRKQNTVSRPSAGQVMPTSLGSSPESDAALRKKPHVAISGGGTPRVPGSSPSEPGGLAHSKTWFSYKLLSEATNRCSSQNLLGKGGFGLVYKGRLPDGREVAVKQLKIGGSQGDREFRAEVEIISRIHHRHLVSLVGYCISEKRKLLVYDYVPNNTLHYHLHGEGRPVLGWATRVKIASGAARGIAYLHEDCHPRVIHRDIKSSNILLDNNFEALVSDFGLAKLFMDENTHVTTRVVGTFGYMAPEYTSSGKLTEKSDVFSFGVVLLELITGRKPVDSSLPPGQESLVVWARPLLNHALETEEFDNLVDKRLEKCFVDNEILLMIEAAAACVRHSSLKRPSMGQVVRAFESISAANLSNGMRVGDSVPFNDTGEISLFQRMAFGNQDFTSEEGSSLISEGR